MGKTTTKRNRIVLIVDAGTCEGNRAACPLFVPANWQDDSPEDHCMYQRWLSPNADKGIGRTVDCPMGQGDIRIVMTSEV